jgi:Tol biopolymer transport system component
VVCNRRPRAFLTLALSVALAGVGCENGGEKNVPLGKRWLAFALVNGVYVARADGSGMKRLTYIREFEYQPDWSPDGRKLVLRVDGAEGKPGTGVYVATVGRKRAVNLSEVSGVLGGDPDWSPDGKRIAFVGKRNGDAHFGIYVMNADGSNPKRLAPADWESQYPDWSPDGRKIVFTGVKNFVFDLYVMNADGSDLSQLTRTPDEENWPNWSPDGKQIVYSFQNGLRVIDADGSDSRVLTEGGEPSWSPDGRWIAFDCGTSEVGRMCAIRPDGSARTRILPGLDGGFPAWRPPDE